MPKTTLVDFTFWYIFLALLFDLNIKGILCLVKTRLDFIKKDVFNLKYSFFQKIDITSSFTLLNHYRFESEALKTSALQAFHITSFKTIIKADLRKVYKKLFIFPSFPQYITAYV